MNFKNLFQKIVTKHPKIIKSSVVLTRRRIYIVPSHGGILYAFVLLLMLAGSMNYHNSMGYVLTFTLASVAIISLLHTYRNLAGLQVEVGKTKPVFVGESAQFHLWINNYGQYARYALTWQKPTDFKIFQENESTQTAHLTIDVIENQRVEFILPVSTRQRGQVSLGEIVVSSQFPVGLFRAWSYIELDASTLVYPAPVGNRQLPRSYSKPDGQGDGHKGNGEDFIGYRDYNIGDSPRHIDWKAAAREQGWLVKQFSGSRTTEMWFTWEDVAMLNQVEAALSQLCIWILIADNYGAHYGLKIPDILIAPNAGGLHREQCLQALALYQLDSKTGLT